MKARTSLGLLVVSSALLASTAGAALDERAFIDSFYPVPASVKSVVASVLPESSAVGTSFLSGAYDPNLVLTEAASVRVTFVHEGAGFRNSLGYFTYRTDGGAVTIVDRQLVLPNASYADPKLGWGGGTLVPGDTVTLRNSAGVIRVFQPGERIGFFIVAYGWNGTSVAGWNPASPALPFVTSAQNANARVYTTLDALNPETSAGFPDKARHVAMIRVDGRAGFLDGKDFLLTGFEDLRRNGGSDEDFNDLVLAVHSNPPTAISHTEVPRFEPGNPDPDGDGVRGLADYFPNDAERAFVVRTPPIGWQTLAFEDRYPNVGDADYNDAVIQMAHEEVLSANGKLKALSGTYHLIARGASLDHSFGMVIPGVASGASGTVEVEAFEPNALVSTREDRDLGASLAAARDGSGTLLIDDLFPDTRAALSPEDGAYTNTIHSVLDGDPASVRFVATFDAAITRAPLGAAPFDPFLSVWRGDERDDIHLPGKRGLASRAADLPDEAGATTFVDANGFPFAILAPTSWRFPLERIPIEQAYPAFSAWRTSRGAQQTQWYASPSTSVANPRVTNPLLEVVRTRAWTLRASETP